MNVTHLECGLCGLEHEARRLLNLCRACGKPLLVRYDLNRSKTTLTKESLAARRPDLWRYREVLPVDNDDNIISLGEGWTPLLRAKRLGKAVGIHELYIKDESQNPTQSFKARGWLPRYRWRRNWAQRNSLFRLPEMQRERWLLTPLARDSESFIFMPRDTPRANVVECEQTGAHVTLMDGLDY